MCALPRIVASASVPRLSKPDRRTWQPVGSHRKGVSWLRRWLFVWTVARLQMGSAYSPSNREWDHHGQEDPVLRQLVCFRIEYAPHILALEYALPEYSLPRTPNDC